MSNAEGLEILSNYYPGYWWDHTDLTVAVQAHPKATEAQLEAIHAAIATWSQVLEDCFDGAITLSDVTGSGQNPQKAADLESTDLMGYGWPDLGDPALSDCDIDALAFVFAWVFEGSDPHPPAEGPYDCSLISQPARTPPKSHR